jgi:hypothetical protein
MRPTLDELATERDAFIDNPGTDPDYDGICDEIGHDEDEDEKDLNTRWFDHVMDLFREMSGTGTITVHRRISVEDPDAFISSVGDRPLGCSWSWDEESASCDYHPETNHEHEVLLTAQAPVRSVCWQDSMVQHFGHPHEREIVVEGIVRDLVITLEGRVLVRIGEAQA